ncbi:BlaI/MecI/CopY family transcriptional regulator [Candidatus Woesearchaeota archaeon]|nr:BlaI/MecI/CopY family transcriptional regulator [Candidatus Woesearchaeota archaeon]
MKMDNSLGKILSPLESDVLSVIWPSKKMKVREVYSVLKPKRKVALSSVAVILDRLYEKSIVDREIQTCRGGLRYLYFPKKDRKEFEKSVVESTVNALIERFGKTAINYFNERFPGGK